MMKGNSGRYWPRVRGTVPEVEAAARVLRKEMTPAEKVLWTALRGRQLNGLKFRRQYPIGPYILDFCCPSHRLVVEVDGSIHAEQVEYDQARDEHLQAYGYYILRFSNHQVLNSLNTVLNSIATTAKQLIQTPPLPELGEGAGG